MAVRSAISLDKLEMTVWCWVEITFTGHPDPANWKPQAFARFFHFFLFRQGASFSQSPAMIEP